MKPFILESLPLKNLDWSLFIELIGSANAELARFDGVIRGIPNPFVLLSPLQTNEAVLSSRMEGTQATLQDVLFFEAMQQPDENPQFADIQEIINYRKALMHAVTDLKKRPLNLNLIKDLHCILMETVRGADKRPGEFRTSQNWIGTFGAAIDKAFFIPPEPRLIPESLYNLEEYFHYRERDRLVQLAVIHAQFEIIHPFLDGNGRLGRMFIPLFLFANNLLIEPCYYISEYLQQHQDEYNLGLRGISDKGDWNGWIAFFLRAVIAQAQSNTTKAIAILSLYNEVKRKVHALASSYSLPALDSLFQFPIFPSPDFVKYSGIPRASAARLLTSMTRNGLLDVIQEGKGKRPTIYRFTELISIILETK